MTEISIIKCDGLGCTNEIKKTFSGILFGLQLVIESGKIKHFCCRKCLFLYADLLRRDERRSQAENAEAKVERKND